MSAALLCGALASISVAPAGVTATETRARPAVQADLVLTGTQSPSGSVNEGTGIQYRLEVANRGPSGATDVHVAGSVPTGVTLVAAPGCDVRARSVDCGFDPLAPGQSVGPVTVTVLVGPDAPPRLRQCFEIDWRQADTEDPDPGNNQVCFTNDVTGPPPPGTATLRGVTLLEPELTLLSGVAVTVCDFDLNVTPVPSCAGQPEERAVSERAAVGVLTSDGNGRFTVTVPVGRNYLLEPGRAGFTCGPAAAVMDPQSGVTYDVTLLCSREAPTAALGGVVWQDRNGNGSREAGDEPVLPGARVRLSRDGTIVAGPQRVGSSGRFRFEVDAGTYRIQFELPANHTDSAAAGDNQARFRVPGADSWRQTAAITITGDEREVAHDAGFVPLPGSISGLLFQEADANGDVSQPISNGIRDEADPPLEQPVTVSLRDATGTFVDQVETTGGSFAFTDLSPGEYEIELPEQLRVVIDPPFFQSGTIVTSVALLLSQSPADPFQLLPGENARYRFAIDPGGDLVRDVGFAAQQQQPLGAIGGLVWVESGDPTAPGRSGIGGVELEIEGPVAIEPVTTEQDGTFLRTLPAGSYTVRILTRNVNVAGVGPVELVTDPEYRIELADGDSFLHADFGFGPGGVIEPLATIRGVVCRDEDGDGGCAGDPPEPGVTVRLSDRGGSAVTDTDGRYVIESVAPGSYALSVADVSSNLASPGTITVAVRGGSLDGVDVALALNGSGNGNGGNGNGGNGNGNGNGNGDDEPVTIEITVVGSGTRRGDGGDPLPMERATVTAGATTLPLLAGTYTAVIRCIGGSTVEIRARQAGFRVTSPDSGRHGVTCDPANANLAGLDFEFERNPDPLGIPWWVFALIALAPLVYLFWCWRIWPSRRRRKQAKLLAELMDARRKGPEALRAYQDRLGRVRCLPDDIVFATLLAQRGKQSWDQIFELVEHMHPELRKQPAVKQQYAMALNRAGRGDAAEAELEQLLAEEGGDTAETRGILGRVYKDRWLRARHEGDGVLAAALLGEAIDTYRRGFEAEGRSTYPGINALTLLEIQDPEDPRRAAMLPVVAERLQQRMEAGDPDYWDYATALELAVITRDRHTAHAAMASVIESMIDVWEIETTLNNIGLLRVARRSRGEDVEWILEIEDALAAAIEAGLVVEA